MSLDDVPAGVVAVAGATRREQLSAFVPRGDRDGARRPARSAWVPRYGRCAGRDCALANYERIYTRPESVAQSDAVIAVLCALVSFYLEHPERLPAPPQDPARLVHAAIAYVGGMTDRFAFDTAVQLLGWDPARLPRPQ